MRHEALEIESVDEVDPIADLLRSDDESAPDLPEDIADELAALAEQTYADTTGPLVPPGFSLFAIKPEAAEKIRKAGRDPRLVSVRVMAVHNGQKTHTVGRYSAEGLTREKLRTKLPPGTYDLQGLTIDQAWVGGRRVHLDGAERIDGPSRNGHAPSNGHSSGQSPAEMLMMRLALRAVEGPQSRSSEMEAATGAMMKTITAMMQMQMADLKMRLAAADVEDRKAGRSSSQLLDVFKLLLPYMKQSSSKGSSGAGAGAGLGKFEDFLGVLQFGMHLAQNASGAPKEDDDQDSLKSWVLPLAESIGPGVISGLSMLLPADKAKMINDLLESQQRAREAEARGYDEESDDPPTVDAEGVPVGGDE